MGQGTNQGYNLSFKLLLEGVNTPFKSANIICTPNGVEASINVFANRYIYELKPKTAVQIFYRDWIPDKHNRLGWRLMFDGAYSSLYKTDQATEGRMVSLVCRDFRMDIRRAPAALSYSEEVGSSANYMYSMEGIFQTVVVPGINKPGLTQTLNDIRMYNGDLNPLDQTLRMIAGTAYGNPVKGKDGTYHYSGFGTVPHSDERGNAKCGFFLDAIVRGLWMEAVGGTTVGQFLNKRLRVEKKFLIPSNRAGYNIWNRQSAGLQLGTYMMGEARFTSVEAAIMRVAGLFSTRVYSCSTPSLIPIGDNETGKPNPSVDMIMDSDVRKFLIDRASAEFGGKYILNETMLLPPLEFTAPPNCNIMLPPIYDRVVWQYDMDADVTRGYYDQIDSFSTPESTQSFGKFGVQVPNALFHGQTFQQTALYKQESPKDQYGRVKPPLTLEERYKGINVSYGSVEYNLAADDAALAQIDWKFNHTAGAKIKDKIYSLQIKKTQVSGKVKTITLPKSQQQELTKKQDALQKRRVSGGYAPTGGTFTAMRRHALIKFLNSKYSGRVVTIDMVFNPYVMCGFPGIVVDDEEAAGGQSSKSIIGMVQQVKHLIYISSEGAEASTSAVMNNARLVDEPTDMDELGNPLYMKQTDPDMAVVDNNTLWYKHSDYYVPEPTSGVTRVLNNKCYDLAQTQGTKDYIYAKDVLSITAKMAKSGASNIIYIDPEYEPQRIAKFYRDVLQHNEDSFMIGNDGTEKFVYDTIHEASVELRRNRPELLYDYTAAMKFISRKVCSADAFYQGILGLSVLNDGEYTCSEDHFDDTIIYDEYFGVTTELFMGDSIDGLIATNNPNSPSSGLMTQAGDCSSILETMPVTAFISERKDSVKKYIIEASKVAQGTTFSLPTIKG